MSILNIIIAWNPFQYLRCCSRLEGTTCFRRTGSEIARTYVAIGAPSFLLIILPFVVTHYLVQLH